MTNGDMGSGVMAAFSERFGRAADGYARAPGRVNLIGEHTDYNGGYALPAALGVGTWIAFRRRSDTLIRAMAADFGDEDDQFSAAEPIAFLRDGGWRNYVRGVFAILGASGRSLPGVDLLIAGNVPKCSGLSSSASLEVALVSLVLALNGERFDPVRAALLAQRAENDFVGMRCGNLDQLASAGSTAGSALLIDCRDLVLQPVAIPEDLAILIVQSGVERGLVDGQYNLRRQWCEQAAQALGVPFLREADMATLERAHPALTDESFRAARHVITENARTLAAAAALSSGQYAELGRLMMASQDSMRDDFRITVDATERLAAIINDMLGGDGGARQTGGGFGGAVVAVMPRARMEQVVAAVRRTYRTPAGDAPNIMIEAPGRGASVVME